MGRIIAEDDVRPQVTAGARVEQVTLETKREQLEVPASQDGALSIRSRRGKLQ